MNDTNPLYLVGALVVGAVISQAVGLLFKGKPNHEAAGAQNKSWWVLTIAEIVKTCLAPICEILVRIENLAKEILANQRKQLNALRRLEGLKRDWNDNNNGD